MAVTYYFCDGNTKTATSITMTQTSLPPTQYTDGAGTIYTRTNARLTFTASVTPLQDIRLYYTYETRNRIDPNPWLDNWFTVTSYVILPAGQSSVYTDVYLTDDSCWSDGSEDVGSYDEGW